jgi:hypothetical protein
MAESKDYLGEYIPIAGRLTDYHNFKRKFDSDALRLTQEETDDFRV